MLNKVIVSGRLGADPRIHLFDNGGKSAQFNLAVTERGYTKQDGTEVADKTNWIRVETSATGIAGVVEKYLKKGSFVTIDGRLRNRDWEKDGVKQYVTSVVIENLYLPPRNGEGNGNTFMPPPPEPEPPKEANNAKPTSSGSKKTTAPPVVQYDDDDDLPF